MNAISTARSPIIQPRSSLRVSVSQKPNQLSVKGRIIVNLDTDTFSTRPTCLLLYLLLVCVAHAYLFSEVQKKVLHNENARAP